jgi:tetratricopeptide (TPR) repeat protein
VADGITVRGVRTVNVRLDAPYPGSRPFSQAEQDRFFGRETEASALAELWQDNRMVLVAGPAASGKTSLLQAGVLPILTRHGAQVLPPGTVTSCAAFPSAALPAHNSYTLALLRSWSPGESPARLVDLSVRDFIAAQARPQGGPIYAAIDHADDLLADSVPRLEYRDRFLAELADAVDKEPRLHLLLLAREDGAALVTEKLERAARFDLGALTPRGAVEAVTGPVVGTEWSFAPAAAEKLVADLLTSRVLADGGVERVLRAEHVEPSLLQAACKWLWDSLPPDASRITVRDIRLYGDVDKALAAYCGLIMAAVADDFDRPVAWIRRWLLRSFITDLGTRGMTYEGRRETAGVPNAIARALADKHLLSVAPRSGSRWYQLLADRLIQPLREAADELPPDVAPAEYLAAAERALTQGQLDVAQRYAGVALRSSSDTDLWQHAEAESLMGNIASERGESATAEAESHYRAAARLFEVLHDIPAVANTLAAIGQVLIAQGRAEDALDELKAAIDRMPSDPVIQTDLALAFWGLGEVDAAIAVLDAFLTRDGGNTLALRARGEILADRGDPRAMMDLDRVTLEERPTTRAARGLALARLGDQSGANAEVDDAVDEAPQNGTVLLRAARAKSVNGDEGAAWELARRAVDAHDPRLPPFHRDAALELASQKKKRRNFRAS